MRVAFSAGFGVLPEKYHAAALWSYQNYFAKANGDEFAFDTSYYPHPPSRPGRIGPWEPARRILRPWSPKPMLMTILVTMWCEMVGMRDARRYRHHRLYPVKGGTRSNPGRLYRSRCWSMVMVEIPTGWTEKGPNPLPSKRIRPAPPSPHPVGLLVSTSVTVLGPTV